MNICYIITSTIKCGPVNVLFNTVKDYQKYHDFHPFVITLKNDDPCRSRRSEFRQLGIKVVQFDPRHEFNQIIKFMSDNSIDIIHSHGLGPDIVNYRLVKELPSLIHMTTLHNFPLEDYVINRGKIKGLMMSALQLWAISNLYKVSCSNAIQEKFKRKLNIQTTAIENGVLYPTENEVLQITKNDRPVFLYLGDIHKRKNTSFLVDFFASHPQYELWIVGDGEGGYYDDVKRKAQSISNVVMWGRTKDPSKFYRKADFLISDSYSEGLPMTVLESYSWGLPVILSDIPSHQEALKSSNWGKLFRLDNAKDLEQVISHAVAQTYDRRGIYSESKRYFSSEVMMDHYVTLYKSLMEGSDD